MKCLLLILPFLVACSDWKDTLSDVVNYDHCEIDSESYDECLNIKIECSTYSDGVFTPISNWDDDPFSESGNSCCCDYE